MAFPATITTDGTVSFDGRTGPYVSSTGDLFVATRDGSSGSPFMFKSTNGGHNWDSGTSMGQVINNDNIDMAQSGDTLYVTCSAYSGSGADWDTDVYYREFNMATGAWTGTVETVWSTTRNPGPVTKHTIARRTSDSVIMLNSYGTAYEESWFIRGTAGSWSSPVQLDAGDGDYHYRPGFVIVGSQAGEAHFIWHGSITSGGGADQIFGRTLDASNTLSTETIYTTSYAYQSGPLKHNGATWDDSGTQRIIFDWSTNYDNYRIGTEDASDDIDFSSTGSATPPDAAVTRRAVAYYPADNELYMIYHYDSNDDIYYSKAAAGTATTWDSDVLLQTASATGLLTTEVITHSSGNGGADVLGVMYASGTNVYYTELDLTGVAITHTSDAIIVYPTLETTRPNADTVATGWDSAPTASQDLYLQVDEATPSDTDYIYAENPNP